jgi:autotransporter-associated beta strand protein
MSKTLRGRRWTGWLSRRPSLLRPFPSLHVEELEARSTPATFTWTGASGSMNWSNPGNWQGGVAPTGAVGANDSLVFPAGLSASVRNPINDITNGTFSFITISDSNYNITGKSLTLGTSGTTGNITVGTSSQAATGVVIGLDIGLGLAAGNKQFFTVDTGSDLTIGGRLSGSTGSIFTKEGNGILVLSNDNTGFTGPILIDDNAGTLEIRNALALGDTSSETTVGTNSTLQMRNVVGAVAEQLRLNGPGVSNLGALKSVAGTNTWAGPIILDSNATFGATSGTTLVVSGVISDTGTGRNVTKEEFGEVQFNNANTYRGTTIINNGVLSIGNPQALGTADRSIGADGGPLTPGGSYGTGTIVNETNTKAGRLQIGNTAGSGFTVLNEALILNGDGAVGAGTLDKGSLYNAIGNNNWAGPVYIGSNVSNVTTVALGAASGTDLILSGVVAPPLNSALTFGIQKVQPGRVILNNANTFAGGWTIFAGILNIRDSSALGPATAVNSVSVNNGATLQMEVEAATTTPRFGYDQTTGTLIRDLWNDSVTADPNRLNVPNNLFLTGLGAGNLGALHSLSGINIYSGTIRLNGQAGIGVALDQRPGHPTPTLDYFTNDYSLTPSVPVRNLIDSPPSNDTLVKRDLGHLILSANDTYSGQTLIQQGWITITTPGALSSASTVVSNGAALHVKSTTPTFTISQNITLAGDGIAHPYQFISGKGALMALSNNVIWGLDSVTGNGDIILAGTAGLGAEAVFAASSLTVNTSISQSVAGSGINKWGSQLITLTGDGTYTGPVSIKEGVLLSRNNTALGEATSGTFNSQQTYTQTTTTVSSGSSLVLQRAITNNSGGIANGIDVSYEKLVLNASAQQVHYAGDTTNPFALFTLKYTSPFSANTFTTGALHITASAQEVEDALNWVDPLSKTTPSLVATDGETAKVTKINNVFVIRFGNVLTLDVPDLVATAVPPPPGFSSAEVQVYNGKWSLINLADDNTWRGPVTLNAGTRIDVENNSRLSLLGTIDDDPVNNPTASDLTKRGTGDLLLAGNNTFRGQALISAGIVTAASGLAFGYADGTAASGTVIANNAQLQIQGNLTFTGEALTVQGTGTGGSTLTDQWFNVGPAPTNQGFSPSNRPTTGRVTSVASDPANPKFIYVATAGGGAWKTKDGGLTWHPLFEHTTADAAAVMYGGQIVVASDGTVYFATGEADGPPNGSPVPGPGDSYAGTGVYKSTNGGLTWALLTGPNGLNPLVGLAPTKLVVDPLWSSRIYVATSAVNMVNSYPTSPTPIAGVYRFDPTNGWVNITLNASPNRLGSLGAAPYDGKTLEAPGNAGPDDDYRIKFPQGGAVAWTDLVLVKEGDALTTAPYNRGNLVSVPGQAVQQAYVLYAALGYSTQQYFQWSGTVGDTNVTQGVFNAVYRTENPTSANPTWWLGNGSIYPPQGTAPTDPDKRGEGNYYPVGTVAPGSQSSAGRDEWIKLAGVVTSYYTASANASITVYGSNLGNSVTGWPYPNGLDDRYELLDLQVSSADGGVTGNWGVVVKPGTPAFGVTSQINPPFSWATGYYDNTLLIQDYNPGLIGSNNPSVLYIGGKDGIFQTTNPGSASVWNDITTAPGVIGPAGNFHALYLDRTNHNLLSGSDGGIWSYNGASFSNLNGTLAVTQLTSADPHPFDINQALVASYNNGVQQYTGGLAWQQLNLTGGDNAGVVRYNQTNAQIAYSVQNGVLYKTTDGGANWSPITTASTSRNNPPMVLDAQNQNRIVLAGDLGTPLMESVDGGASFNTLAAPFSPTAIALATFQGPFVADSRFPNVIDKLSNKYDPDTLYITNGSAIQVTKNLGLSWSNSTPTVIDNNYRIQFDGYLKYKQIPQMTVTPSAGVYATIKTTFDGTTGSTGYPGEGETQSVEVVTTDANGTFTLTFSYTDPTLGLVTGTTTPISVNATALDVQDAVDTLLQNLALTGPEIQRITMTNLVSNSSMTLTYTTQAGGSVATNSINLTGTAADAALIETELNALSNMAPNTVTVTFVSFGVFDVRWNDNAVHSDSLPLHVLFATPSNVTVKVWEVQKGGQAVSSVKGFGSEVDQVTVSYDLANAGTAVMTVRFGNGFLNQFTIPVSGGAAGMKAAIEQLPFMQQLGGTVTVTVVSTQSPQPNPTSQTDVYTITFNGGNVANTDVRNISMPSFPATLQNQLTGFDAFTVSQGARVTGSGPTYTNLAVDQANRDVVYATAYYANGQNGPTLFRSTDAGQTWTDITGNLPTVPTWTGAFDPRVETLYIGNDQGVWKLTNAVNTSTFTWTQVGTGLLNVQVHDLVLNQTLNTLTAATYGRGMFQMFVTDYQNSSGAIRALSGNSNWTGPVTLTGNTTIQVDGTQNVQNGIANPTFNILGTINDSGGNRTITKTGKGTLIFSGSNTYGGQTLVTQGVLQVANPNALGASTPAASANTVVTAGAALELASDLYNEPVTLNGDGFSFNGHNTGSLRNVSGSNTYTGTLTFGTNVTIGVNSGTQLTIGGVPGNPAAGTGTMTDGINSFTLTKELTGTLVLASANTYDGKTTINQGALRVEDANALGSSGQGTFVVDGAQIQISRNVVTLAPTIVTSEPLFLTGSGIFGTGAILNVRGDAGAGANDNTWQGPIQVTDQFPASSPPSTPAKSVAFGSSDVRDTLTIDVGITQFSAGFDVVKVGAGRVTFAQNNFYSGTTYVNAGYLQVRTNAALGTGTAGTVVNAGTLELYGPSGPLNITETLTINGDGVFNVGALNNVFSNNTYAGSITIASDASIGAVTGTQMTVTGLVQDPVPAPVPAGRLRKAGAGTIVFPTANTYTGNTVIDDGILNIRTPTALGTPKNETQQIQVLGTSGSFALTYRGQTTIPIRFDATAAEVKSALEALSTIGGVGGTVDITLDTSTPGIRKYNIAFNSALQNTNTAAIDVIYVAPVINTVQNGTATQQEVQTAEVIASAGGWALTYGSSPTLRTPAISVNATAAEVQAAIEAILGVGSVSVSRGGFINDFTYTIAFNSFGDKLQFGSAVVGGTLVTKSTTNDGAGGTTVNAGGTLQVQGSMNFSFPATGEILTLNGQGFGGAANGLGALNILSGNVTFTSTNPFAPLPILLGSNASIGVSGVTDTLSLLGPISDAGNNFGIDLYGLGTTTYGGTGTSAYNGNTYSIYTGTTTVHSGLLLLNVNGSNAIRGSLIVGDDAAPNAIVRELQNNQVADNSAVRVKSDGTFDLNAKTDTVGNLTVTGGLVQTQNNGHLTTGTISMTGGLIAVGNDASLAGGDTTMTAGAQITVGVTMPPSPPAPLPVALTLGNVSMDASSITFATPGPAAFVSGNITMANGSTIVLPNGTMTSQDITVNGGGAPPYSTLTLGDASSLSARNINVLNSGVIGLGNGDSATASGAVSVSSGGMIQFGTTGTFAITGALTLADGQVLMGNGTALNRTKLSTASIGITGGTSKIQLGDFADLTSAGAVSDQSGQISLGNNGTFTAGGLVSVTAGSVSFGTNGQFNNQPNDLSLDGATFSMQDGGSATTRNVTLANSSAFSFGNNGTLTSSGNLTMSGGSQLTFLDNGSAITNIINQTGGLINFRDGGKLQAGNVTDVGGAIHFRDGGLFIGATVSVSGAGSIGFGTQPASPPAYPYVSPDGINGTFVAIGPLTLDNAQFWMGNNANASAATLSLLNGSMLFLNDGGLFGVAGNVSLTGNSSMFFGNNDTLNGLDLNQTGGSISFQDGGKLQVANVTASGGTIGFLNDGVFNAGTVSVTNGGLSFVNHGTFTTTGNLTLNKGTVVFSGPNGTLSTKAVSTTGASKIQMGNTSTATTTTVNVGTGGSLVFGNGDSVTSNGSVTITNASASFGTGGTWKITGDLGLSNSTLTLGNTGTVQVLGTGNVSLSSASKITFADTGTLDAAGDVTMTGSSKFTYGNTAVAKMRNLSITTGSISMLNGSLLQASGVINDLGAPISLGANSTFNAAGDVSIAVSGANPASLTIGAGSTVGTGKLTVTTANVTVGAGSGMTTGDTTITGTSKIQVGDNSTWTAGAITDTTGTFTFGNNVQVNSSGAVSVTGGSIVFGTAGKLQAAGDLTLDTTPVTLGIGGQVIADDIFVNNKSKITFSDNATLKANGTLNENNGQIKFGNTASLTAGNTTLDNSSITGGTGITVSLGTLTMDPSTFSVSDNSNLTIGDIDITGGSITVGKNSSLVTGGITDAGAVITVGNTSTFTAGAVLVNSGGITLGNAVNFTASGLTLINTLVTQGTTGAFTINGDLVETQSQVSLQPGGSGSAQNLNLLTGQLSLGNGRVFALSGGITAASQIVGPSSIDGLGTLNLGNTTHSVNVTNGDTIDDIDLVLTANIASSSPATILKSGDGRLQFAPIFGSSTNLTILSGDVQVDTSAGNVVLNGGTLSGGQGLTSGVVGTIAGGTGTINPGNNWASPNTGILQSGNAVFTPQTVFEVDLSSSTPGSPAAGTDYDQLQVNGTIDLGGAQLVANYGAGILNNDAFTIITATGGVTNKFQQFDGQDITFVTGQKFTIEYTPTSVILHKVKADATVSMVSAPNPSTLNQTVTLTATVVPEPGSSLFSHTTTVTFKDNGAPIGTAFVDQVGSQFLAVLPISSLAVGSHPLTATFDGDAVNFNPSNPSNIVTQSVEQPIVSAFSGSPAYISPNNSSSIGTQDHFNITAQVAAERSAINWTVSIKSGATTIQTITGAGNPGAGTTIPISTFWDGTKNAANGGGFAADGDYTASLTVTDGFGNTFFSSGSLPVRVDNLSPTASIQTPTQIVIDPTGASTLPTNTTISGTVGDLNLAGWVVEIRNGATLLRSFSGTGTSVSANWNGKYNPADPTDPNGTTVAPDAAYAVTITATDLAGNKTTTSSRTVLVLANGPIVTLTSNTPTVYGQTFTLTASVDLPAGSPLTLVSLLANDTVRFFQGATQVGTDQQLAFNAGAGKYQASVTLPTMNAGSYNFQAKYLATTDFPQGISNVATHVISKAPLTVTAQNASRLYGAANPTLTFLTSGLVNGDLAQNVFSNSLGTTATATSSVLGSPYPINQGTLTPNGNYFIQTFNPANLTITPAPLTIQVNDASRPVNTPNPTPFTYTVLGLKNGDPASVVTSVPLSTTATISSPVGSYPISSSGTPTVGSNYFISSILPGTLAVTPVQTRFSIGSGAGGIALVSLYAPNGTLIKTLTPFGTFFGGVRTVTADFNGDGVEDLAVGTGPGAVAQVSVFDGVTGANLFTVLPFETFTGGVFVAAGDIDANGKPELVVTPDEGGGPRVLVYHDTNFAPMLSYFGIQDPNFRGGARAGVGDMNGDGYAEIAVSAGFQGGPRVSIWDGKSLASSQFKNVMNDFFVFDQSLRNGAYVAIGDVNGDGKGDLIAGAGPGGAPHVKIFDGASLINPAIGPANTQPFASFFAGNPDNRGGVRVTPKVLDNDLYIDVLTGVGDGGGDTATAYLGVDLKDGKNIEHFTLDAFPGLNNNGVFVG